MENIELRSIVKRLPVGIILMDDEGIIRSFSDEFSRIISKKHSQLENQKLETLLTSSSQKPFRDYLRGHKNNKPSKVPDSRQYTIDTGQGKSCGITLTALTNESGGKACFIGIIEHRLNQEEHSGIYGGDNRPETQYTGQDEEKELSEMRSRFLSIASHEFRTPLTGILSSLNLIDRYLKADHDTWMRIRNREKVANHLKTIHESVKNLTTILDKFLSLENIQKGTIPVNYFRFNLKKTLEAQKSQLQQVCKTGQVICYHHDSKETVVSLDKFLIKNIMNNLLSNAIKYSPPHSEIQLTSSITPDSINISISDQGIGIPEDEQNMVFHRFFRAKNAPSDQAGAGLGLNIVKEYVELMEGCITFNSRENAGTTFFITFPNTRIDENYPRH